MNSTTPPVQYGPVEGFESQTIALTFHTWTQQSKDPNQIVRCSIAFPGGVEAFGFGPDEETAVSKAVDSLKTMLLRQD
jgi:hypothetical protein